jgi:hypothetical protein
VVFSLVTPCSDEVGYKRFGGSCVSSFTTVMTEDSASYCRIKVKGKILLSGNTVPLILNCGTRQKCVVSFRLWPLFFPGKDPRYPLDRRLCGPQNQPGHGCEEKKSHCCPYRELNHGRSTRSLVIVLTELPRVLMAR